MKKATRRKRRPSRSCIDIDKIKKSCARNNLITYKEFQNLKYRYAFSENYKTLDKLLSDCKLTLFQKLRDKGNNFNFFFKTR